jgi:lactoylglutathione lyase
MNLIISSDTLKKKSTSLALDRQARSFTAHFPKDHENQGEVLTQVVFARESPLVPLAAIRSLTGTGRMEADMKYGYTALFVESVHETIDFYERAFGLKRKMVQESGEYGELQTGDTTLAFTVQSIVKTLSDVTFEPAALHKAAPPLELGMVTDSVDADFERAVAAGAVIVKHPHDKPWGRVAYVRDNNGFLIEIVSHTTG